MIAIINQCHVQRIRALFRFPPLIFFQIFHTIFFILECFWYYDWTFYQKCEKTSGNLQVIRLKFNLIWSLAMYREMQQVPEFVIKHNVKNNEMKTVILNQSGSALIFLFCEINFAATNCAVQKFSGNVWYASKCFLVSTLPTWKSNFLELSFAKTAFFLEFSLTKFSQNFQNNKNAFFFRQNRAITVKVGNSIGVSTLVCIYNDGAMLRIFLKRTINRASCYGDRWKILI